MKQEKGEKFDKFVQRLQYQAEKCSFTNTIENIIDQITEKCLLKELKQKILTNDNINLDNIIVEANKLEAVHRQIEQYSELQKKEELKKMNISHFTKNKHCTRCTSLHHNTNDITCPAINKRCRRCGYVGHYTEVCFTKKIKRLGYTNHADYYGNKYQQKKKKKTFY